MRDLPTRLFAALFMVLAAGTAPAQDPAPAGETPPEAASQSTSETIGQLDTIVLAILRGEIDPVRITTDTLARLGPDYFIQGTIGTVIAIFGLFFGLFIMRWVRRRTELLVSVSAGEGEADRLIGGRQNRAIGYVNLAAKWLRILVWLASSGLLLAAWGLDVAAFLARDWVQTLISTTISLALIIAIAFVIQEVIDARIHAFLTAVDKKSGETRERSQRVRTLLPLMRNAARVFLWVIIAMVVLSELGIDIGPLIAGAGVIGLAVGFGAQSLVKDVITGLFILVEDQISVGDVVVIGGTGGLVEAMSIRTLRLRGLDGAVHTIPFGEIARVTNLTKEFSYYVFDIGVAYRENVDAVIEVVRQLGAEIRADENYAPLILEDIEILGVDKFADSAVIIKARIKTRPIQQWTVGREFNRRMKNRFDELGIEIPFPHQTIYFGVDKDGSAAPAQILMADRIARKSEPASSASSHPPRPDFQTPDQRGDDGAQSSLGHDDGR